MLKITDLTASKELANEEMAGVRGGFNPFAIFDGSTSIFNKVADVQQAFSFSIAQGNTGQVTNNQAIQGGNGVIFAPVDQTQTQSNNLDLSDIGNIFVS